MGLQHAVKEWAGVVDALGRGVQQIIVRRYEPRVSELLLYPTFNYVNFRGKSTVPFKPLYAEAAWKAGEETMKRAQNDCLVNIDYFAKVDNVLSITDRNVWKRLSKYYIWSEDHVERYANGTKTGSTFLWLLRVSQLPQTVVIGRIAQGGPPDFYKHNEEIITMGSKPVMGVGDYEMKQAEILDIAQARS